jgi:hypothetical protein
MPASVAQIAQNELHWNPGASHHRFTEHHTRAKTRGHPGRGQVSSGHEPAASPLNTQGAAQGSTPAIRCSSTPRRCSNVPSIWGR